MAFVFDFISVTVKRLLSLFERELVKSVVVSLISFGLSFSSAVRLAV